MRQPTKLPLLPSFAIPHFPCWISPLRLPALRHVIRKCGSHPFPLLTERKHCNRGGRRWALLRRWLKITGIFKAAEESQGRQRLDSLPPGRSSLLPRNLFLSLLPRLTPFHFIQTPQNNHHPTHTIKDTAWWKHTAGWWHPCPALSAWLGFSKQTAPADSEQHIHMHPTTRPTCQTSPSCCCCFPYRRCQENSHRLFCHDLNPFLSLLWFMYRFDDLLAGECQNDRYDCTACA